MQQNPGFIIQARTSSSRLPDKILLPFYKNKTILDIIIERMAKRFNNYPIILATTTNQADDILYRFAERWKIKFFRGDEQNVLTRFIEAAKENDLTSIIRICSDNPFLDMDSLDELIQESQDENFDYVSFRVNSKPAIKSHYGLWSEYVTLPALKIVALNAYHDNYKEHVTNYIYENPSLFKIKWIDVPPYLTKAELRFTVDTIEDFHLQQEIYTRLIRRNKNFKIIDLINFIYSEKSYLDLMKEQIKKNQK